MRSLLVKDDGSSKKSRHARYPRSNYRSWRFKIFGIRNSWKCSKHDLNPLEEAQGYKRLIDEFSYDQQKVSKFIGKSRSYITNSLRLLTLPVTVLKYVEEKRLAQDMLRS